MLHTHRETRALRTKLALCMGGEGLIAYYILKLKRGSGKVTYTLRRFVRVQPGEGLRDRSDQTLHVYIVKHDPFGPAKVVVGVSIALHALLLALSRHLSSKTKSRPPRGPGSASQHDQPQHEN